ARAFSKRNSPFSPPLASVLGWRRQSPVRRDTMARDGSFEPPDNVIDLKKFRSQWGTGSWFGQFLRGDFFRKVAGPILLAFVGVKLLFLLCVTYVRPNEYGIKVVRVPMIPGFIKRGVHEEVYHTGFHFVLKPFDCEEMYLFPKDLQVLDLTGAR